MPTEKGAVEVEVVESNERWSDFKLADGSILRAKVVIGSARRVEGQFSENGDPVYEVASANVLMLASSPDSLKRGAKS